MPHPVESCTFNGTYDELDDGWFCFHGTLADGQPHLWVIPDQAIATRMETLGLTNPLQALDVCWQEVLDGYNGVQVSYQSTYYAIQRQKWADEVPAQQAALRTKFGTVAAVVRAPNSTYKSKVIPDTSQRKLVISEDADGPRAHAQRMRKAKAPVDTQIPFSQRLAELAAPGGAIDQMRAQFIDSLIPGKRVDPKGAARAIERVQQIGKVDVVGTIRVD